MLFEHLFCLGMVRPFRISDALWRLYDNKDDLLNLTRHVEKEY